MNDPNSNPSAASPQSKWMQYAVLAVAVIGYLIYSQYFAKVSKTETALSDSTQSAHVETSKKFDSSKLEYNTDDPWAKPQPSTPVNPPAPRIETKEPASPRTPPSSKAPTRDLDADERKRGHTLSRHVGRTDQQLAERLKREPETSTASTYTDKATAERCVGIAIAQSESKIKAWARRGGDDKFVVDYKGDGKTPIGRSLRQGERTPKTCFNSKVVLAMDNRGGDYFVLTSYPEAR